MASPIRSRETENQHHTSWSCGLADFNLNLNLETLVFTSLALTSLLFAATFQSELRVRHREETKNVTRLTMENVSFLVCNAV
jgi:hypothetical protein